MDIQRLLLKIYFKFIRLSCFFLFHLDHRIYMKVYLKLIKNLGVTLNGIPRYIGFHVVFDDFKMISIGDKTTISDHCHLLTHDYSITNVLRAVEEESETDVALLRPIKIGANVFIGKKAIIMPNTIIGDNCIVGAGAVVRGSIPNGSVVIGNPAVVIDTVENLASKWRMVDPTQIKRDKK